MDLDYSDNIEQALRSLDSFFPDESHSLSVEADAGHAHYVHAMDGFWVLNPEHQLEEVQNALSRAIRAGGRLTDGVIVSALTEAGLRETDYLRSHVGLGPDGRPQHPGAWRDRTKELHNSLTYDVDSSD